MYRGRELVNTGDDGVFNQDDWWLFKCSSLVGRSFVDGDLSMKKRRKDEYLNDVSLYLFNDKKVGVKLWTKRLFVLKWNETNDKKKLIETEKVSLWRKSKCPIFFLFVSFDSLSILIDCRSLVLPVSLFHVVNVLFPLKRTNQKEIRKLFKSTWTKRKRTMMMLESNRSQKCSALAENSSCSVEDPSETNWSMNRIDVDDFPSNSFLVNLWKSIEIVALIVVFDFDVSLLFDERKRNESKETRRQTLILFYSATSFSTSNSIWERRRQRSTSVIGRAGTIILFSYYFQFEREEQ